MLLFDHHTHPAAISVIVAISGVGIGFTLQPTVVALQAHCTKSQRAVVISNRNFFRCMGGACGLAISAAVLQATLRSNLPTTLSYLTHSSYSLPSRSNLTDTQWAQVLLSYTDASHAVFILQVPLIAVCFLACVFVRDRGLERPKEPEEVEEEKRKAAQAEIAAEAGVTEQYPEESEHHSVQDHVKKRHYQSTLAESSILPSRTDPDRSGLKETEKDRQ